MPALDLTDHFQQALERSRAGIGLSVGTVPVRLQREGLLESVLKQRPDLAEIVELAAAHRRPLHLPFPVVFEVAQMHVHAVPIVSVSGKITLYKGKPEIKVTSPAQISAQ